MEVTQLAADYGRFNRVEHVRARRPQGNAPRQALARRV